MFLYLYKSRLFCLLRQKNLFLFSIVLPVFLALLFYIGLNNLSERVIGTINLGILGNENSMTDYFKDIAGDDGTSLFSLKFIDDIEGEELLKKGEIKGLIKLGGEPELYVLEDGYDQNILNYYFTRYNWIKNIEKITLKTELVNGDSTVLGRDAVVNRVTNALPAREQIYFYNLLVLVLLLGAKLAFNEVKDILQERSPLGLRIMTVPQKRSTICFCNLLAAFTVHCTGVVLFLTFITTILKIDLLIDFIPLTVISFITSILGFSIGTFVYIIAKANNKVRSTILNTVLIFGSVTAGILSSDIKYLILEKLPLFTYVNPFILVYDIFYNIASSQNFIKNNLNFMIIMLLTIILTGYTTFFIKRRDYAGI